MEQHLNLYLDLEPGQLADLEVVSRASLSFAEAVREIAYIVDPSLSVRLDFESGTEGSLSINSVVRFVKKQVPDPVTRKVILLSLMIWFMQETGSALIGLAVDDLVADEPSISEQDAEHIAERVYDLLDKKVGAEPVRNVYKELERDRSIRGVGVSTEKGARPRTLVPRDEFAVRAEDKIENADDGETRTQPERLLLTLISPVLQKNKNKWRFSSKYGNIYASIEDENFLDDVLSGRSDLKMRSGIVILADVTTKEKKEDGVWHVADRSITHVVSVRTEDDIGDLFSDE